MTEIERLVSEAAARVERKYPGHKFTFPADEETWLLVHDLAQQLHRERVAGFSTPIRERARAAGKRAELPPPTSL